MADEQKRPAAYVPWATFLNALEQLSKGMPSRIDRSVFPGLAWTPQTQLFAALRFFGLLKGEDEPTPLLDDLVKGTPEERKAKLIKVIINGYSDLTAIDLTKATRSHFEEKLGELYNVTGDTRIKSIRFFLCAAEYAGIALSPFILPQKGPNGATRKPRSSTPRPRTAKKPQAQPPPAGSNEPVKPSGGESKTVHLASGGTLTVSATSSFFSLNAADRQFYVEIVDKLEAYEANSKKSKASS
jgi:hypothetical protein